MLKSVFERYCVPHFGQTLIVSRALKLPIFNVFLIRVSVLRIFKRHISFEQNSSSGQKSNTGGLSNNVKFEILLYTFF